MTRTRVVLCVSAATVVLAQALLALSARMAVTKQLVEAVAACDALPPPPQTHTNVTCAAFYAYGGQVRAAEETLRRFRQWYPSPQTNVLLHAESDADVSTEMRRHAVVHRLRPRLRLRAWGSSYANEQEFVSLYWSGLARVARTAPCVLILEDDVWVLRPIPAVEADAAATRQQASTELAAITSRECGRALDTHVGSGGTVLRSSWVLAQSNETVGSAANIAWRAAAKWRVPSDLAIWAALACSPATVATPPFIRTVVHTTDGLIASIVRAPPPQTDTLRDVAHGRVALLHKVKTMYA